MSEFSSRRNGDFNFNMLSRILMHLALGGAANGALVAPLWCLTTMQ